ncbi:MAG: tetratricopeptide repeat protein, partial [Deltaproteobacteria bacterium]
MTNRRPASLFVRALALTFTVSSALACGHRAATRPDVTAAVLPPPVRPNDVLLSAHFGQPRATVDALSTLTGSRIPFELGLALALGVDGTVMAASDTTRPIDLFVTGTPQHPDVVFVFTPATASQFRSTLSNRFRLVRVETLGERLDPQNQPARAPARGTRCAIVGVPGPLPARIVCASRLEALEHAGRFAAYESQRLADTRGDMAIDVDGATARAALAPLATRAIDENNQALAATAAEERRRHDHAPDLGDPEAALHRYRRAMTADPRSDRARLGAARSLIALDRPDEAMSVAHSALVAAPGSLEAAVLLGELYAKHGKQAEAAQVFEFAGAAHPKAFEIAFGLGKSLALLRRPAEAAVALRRAAEIDPT